MAVNTCLDISSQDIKRRSAGNAFTTLMVSAFLTAVSVPVADIEKSTTFSMPRLESTIIEAKQTAEIPRKSIRDRYRRIAKSQWFKNAYDNRSIGEVLTIEE